MEQLKPNSIRVATKWTLISTLTGIVLIYIFQFANIPQISPIRYFSYVPFIAFLLLAQKEHKEQLGGYLKFGQGFSVGLWYGVFSGLLIGIFFYIYYAYLSPEMFAQMEQAQRDAIAAKGLTGEDAEKGADLFHKYGPMFIAFGATIWYAILGIILGLIGAAIFKKERSAFDPEPPADPTV